MRTRESADSYGPVWSGQIHPEQHRERVLSVLGDRELPVSIAELAGLVLDQRDASTRNQDVVDRMRVRLHHVDLPKLHNAGELEYDASNNVVAAQFEGELE